MGEVMSRQIRYLIIDVDGTMTDAGIYYDENGNELKKFCTRDAAAFFAAKKVGISTVVLTGRECEATRRRMQELKVDFLFQNIVDKTSFLINFMQEHGIAKEELGYIGDDLNDLMPMSLAGFVSCPSDGCVEIRNIADYICEAKGGGGVVRETVEYLLHQSGEWEKAISEVYGIGI